MQKQDAVRMASAAAEQCRKEQLLYVAAAQCRVPCLQMASEPSPALLTSYIKKAWTLEALFRTCSTHQSRFNHIHLSACWNSLGHLARTADQNWFQRHAVALESLVQFTTQVVTTSTMIRARELANIVHGAAKSGRACTMDTLMQTLGASIGQRMSQCNAQEIANTAWAFAKAGHLDARLSAALATVVRASIDSFKAQELSNTAWAYATAGYSDELLFTTLARAVERHLDTFTAQGLANTAYAAAQLNDMTCRV